MFPPKNSVLLCHTGDSYYYNDGDATEKREKNVSFCKLFFELFIVFIILENKKEQRIWFFQSKLNFLFFVYNFFIVLSICDWV